ncbi:MAG TPA: PAS domain S-box protein [Methanolinea sp.]|nr:PAS domain S-box protein [Methanolinea sp.]HNQ29824.1 PAS domain S-box protein [Methanolinea sp.]
MREISRMNLAIFLITAVITFAIVLTTIFSLKSGIYDIFPYFYIIPVILIAYSNPRLGVYFTIVLGWIYLSLVYLYGPFDIRLYATSSAWFYIFITLGVVISAFSNEIAKERKFRDIFLNSQAGIFTFRPGDQLIRVANTQVASLLGYTPEEMQNLHIADIIPDTEEMSGFFQKLENEGKISDAEVTLQKKDGSRVWVLITASRTSGDQVICSAVDITERKRIKDELRYTEIHYRALFDSAGDAIIIHDFEGNIFEANAIASEQSGYSRQELEQMHLSDLDILPAREAAGTWVQEIRKKGISIRETLLKTREGATIPVEISSKVIEYYRSPAVITIIRDLRARKEAENALRESERRYRMIGDLIPFGVWITDAGGTLTYASQSFLDLIGMTLDECRRNGWMKKLPVEQRESTRNDWKQCVETGCFWDYEYRIVDRQGTEHFILSRGAPMRDASGRIVSWVGIHFDISQRRRYENRLEASLREKEVIIKEVHHRVKNNMQVISGFLQLQTNYLTDQESIEKLEECQMRVKTMALVHEKLYQSKYLGFINTRDYIQSLISDLMNSYLLRSDISIEQDIDDVNINLDTAIPCGLILNELLTNALKYAFNGRESGTISVSLHLNPDHRFSLDISDDGVGLPPGLDIAQAPTLGLQLVTVLVRQIGGEMQVGGPPGTSFHISFPEKF